MPEVCQQGALLRQVADQEDRVCIVPRQSGVAPHAAGVHVPETGRVADIGLVGSRD